MRRASECAARRRRNRAAGCSLSRSNRLITASKVSTRSLPEGLAAHARLQVTDLARAVLDYRKRRHPGIAVVPAKCHAIREFDWGAALLREKKIGHSPQTRGCG